MACRCGGLPNSVSASARFGFMRGRCIQGIFHFFMCLAGSPFQKVYKHLKISVGVALKKVA
jgi:hypothetical protein